MPDWVVQTGLGVMARPRLCMRIRSTAHLARLAICTAGINWRTGRIWRVDGDIEIAALDCHPPFTAWLNTFWRAGVFCNRLCAVYRPYSIPGAARAAGDARRARAAHRANCAWRLDEQQLRDACVSGLSKLTRRVAEWKGFQTRFSTVARARTHGQRRLSDARCTRRNSLDASRLCLHPRHLFDLAGFTPAPVPGAAA